MNFPPYLICMRRADMKYTHPDQVARLCSECGEEVGVYPSGQEAMKKYPKMAVICHVCDRANHQGQWSTPAPGAIKEALTNWARRLKK